MREFQLAIGSAANFTHGRFNDWSSLKLLMAAARVEKRVGGKPSESDYVAAAATDDESPGLHTIRLRWGSAAGLNERLGYPDVGNWTEDDYIDFGVHFIATNGAAKFKREALQVLSARGRSPSCNAVIKHFPWKKYKSLVLERVAQEQEKVASYRHRGQLPKNYVDFSDAELVAWAARYKLISQLLPTLNQKLKEQIALRSDPTTFVKSLLRAQPELTKEHIEAQAAVMGFQGDIWPKPAMYKHYLVVSDDELAERREINRAKHRAWKERQAA